MWRFFRVIALSLACDDVVSLSPYMTIGSLISGLWGGAETAFRYFRV